METNMYCGSAPLAEPKWLVYRASCTAAKKNK